MIETTAPHPQVFGWMFTGHQIGAAFAAFGGGFICDNCASYLPAPMIAGVLCLMTAPLVLSAGTSKLKPATVG